MKAATHCSLSAAGELKRIGETEGNGRMRVRRGELCCSAVYATQNPQKHNFYVKEDIERESQQIYMSIFATITHFVMM